MTLEREDHEMTEPAQVERSPAPPLPPQDMRLPRTFFVNGAGVLSRDLPFRELMTCRSQLDGRLWVDIDTTSRQQVAVLEKIFNFHPLAIEDVLNPNSRPKVEQYDEYLFITLRVVRFCDDTSDPYDLETGNLSLFLGSNYLVTAHAGPAITVDTVADLAL